MTSTRPWRDIAAAIAEGFAAAPELDELGVTFAGRWVANMATPAILVVPVRRVAPNRRTNVQPVDVRWEVALQVVIGVQGDDDEVLHALLEAALPLVPAGVQLGETVYGQDDRAGGSYLVSTTTLNA